MIAKKFKSDSEARREQDEEKSSRWLVTYCSLAITLVAVFMMLVSYSTVAGGKMTEYRRSIKAAQTAPVSAAPGQVDPTESAISVIREHTQMGGYSSQVEIGRTKNGFKVIIPAALLFAPESAEIREDLLPLLAKMSGILKKGLFSLGVAGHTSDLPVNTASFDSNWVFSGMRAANVAKYIMKSGNIPPARLASAGYGQYRPLAAGSSSDAREKNERVEFLFVLQETISG